MSKRHNRVLMILENCTYSRDARVGKEAKALRSAGYAVTVVSPEAARLPSRSIIEGVAVYGFPQFSFGSGVVGYLLEYLYSTIAIAIITAYVAVASGFDIVHIANPPDCLVLMMSLYKLGGKRIIFDQHDLAPELYAARFASPNRLLLKTQLLLERLSYRLSDHVIVTNASSKQVAMERGKIPESKVTIVRNGPEIEYFQNLGLDIELQNKAKHIIAFAGITGYQDGLDYLCRALKSLRCERAREDFCCVVLGDGDALADTKSYARELGIDDKMWFIGWVSDPTDYRRYLSTAEICVAPEPSNSYNDRSTFVKIVEYMAAAKPIVAFDLPENRFTAAGAALYATTNSHQQFAFKLGELMDHEELRLSMGQLGRQRIETGLAWHHSIPELFKVYRQISGRENSHSLSASA